MRRPVADNVRNGAAWVEIGHGRVIEGDELLNGMWSRHMSMKGREMRVRAYCRVERISDEVREMRRFGRTKGWRGSQRSW